MTWASGYISHLELGRTVSFRPTGDSMIGKINSGDLVTVEPIKDSGTLKIGDIVLCQVDGKHYLHLIKDMITESPRRYLIGNNRGFNNGWIAAPRIFGICTKVEP